MTTTAKVSIGRYATRKMYSMMCLRVDGDFLNERFQIKTELNE